MVVILGLGFTGKRLQRRLLGRGIPVAAVVRGSESHRSSLPKKALLFHSVPPLPAAENAALRELITAMDPLRVVYISSTGVYGDRIVVDENTPAEPSDDRGRARMEEERWISAGPWTSLILRSAAIYGPGRGVHSAVRGDQRPRSAASGIVSRIHVDDLAAIADAAIFSDLQGAWPVADDAPCPSAEIIAWCGAWCGAAQEPAASPARGRIVNGRKIRELLNVQLAYPSWRVGVPASLAEEGGDARLPERRASP